MKYYLLFLNQMYRLLKNGLNQLLIEYCQVLCDTKEYHIEMVDVNIQITLLLLERLNVHKHVDYRLRQVVK